MNQIVNFISGYEKDLDFQIKRIQEEQERTNRQIDELQAKIREIEEARDASYDVFSASQMNGDRMTEAHAMEELIEEKRQYLATLSEEKAAITEKKQQVRNLNYRSVNLGTLSTEELLTQLQRIQNWISVDLQRAKVELNQIIHMLETELEEE